MRVALICAEDITVEACGVLVFSYEARWPILCDKKEGALIVLEGEREVPKSVYHKRNLSGL